MASFPTCANPNGEEEVGDAGGKHGEGKTLNMETWGTWKHEEQGKHGEGDETSCCNDCTEDCHSTATVFVHKAARDGSWKVKNKADSSPQ